MAMTKAEQAQMEALKVRLALAWPPEPPKPVDLDVARVDADVNWIRLWHFNASSKLVELGVTNGHLHSRSNYTDAQLANIYAPNNVVYLTRTAGGPWYATERDALAALHYEVAKQCAETLRHIERRIETATQPPLPTPIGEKGKN